MIFLKTNMLFNVFLLRILRIFYILRIEINIIIFLFDITIYKSDYDILFNVLISYLLNVLLNILLDILFISCLMFYFKRQKDFLTIKRYRYQEE